MNRKRAVKIAAAMLALIMIIPGAALAASYGDTGGHWAEDSIERWNSYGVVKGADGKFRPNEAITRGQMAVILDRLLSYRTEAENIFPDLDENFYTQSVLRANFAGVLLGSNGYANPNAYITRQEAAVMLMRAFRFTGEAADWTPFPDNASIAAWAKSACAFMQKSGYMVGDANGNFNPLKNITRAEIVTILDRVVSRYVPEGGEVTENVAGNLLINSPGVSVGNINVLGNIIIAPGVKNGSVNIENATVGGGIIILNAGSGGVKLGDGVKAGGAVMISAIDGDTSVAVGVGAEIERVSVAGGSGIATVSGKTDEVILATADAALKLESAEVKRVLVSAAEAELIIASSASVKETVTVLEGAERASIENIGQVVYLKNLAEGLNFSNEGTAQTVESNAESLNMTNSGLVGALKATRSASVENLSRIASLKADGVVSVTGTGVIESADLSRGGSGSDFSGTVQHVILADQVGVKVNGAIYETTRESGGEFHPVAGFKDDDEASFPVPSGYSIDNSAKVVKIMFNKGVQQRASSSDFRNMITYAYDGTNFESLSSSDAVELKDDTLTITFRYALSGSHNRIKIESGALKDDSSRALRMNITTPELDPDDTGSRSPEIYTLSPADDAANVELDATLRMTFTKPVSAVSGGYIYIKEYSGNTVFEKISATDAELVSISGSVVTVKHSEKLFQNTGYYVTIDYGAFADNSGNAYAGMSSKTAWNFTTKKAPAMAFGTEKGSFTAASSGTSPAQTVTVPVTTYNIPGGNTMEVSLRSGAKSGYPGVSATVTKTSSGGSSTVTLTGTGNIRAGILDILLDYDGGVASASKTLAVKGGSVSLGVQSKQLTSGAAGSVTIPVVTSNIADGQRLNITVSGNPSGVNASCSSVRADDATGAGEATITVSTTSNTPMGDIIVTISADYLSSAVTAKVSVTGGAPSIILGVPSGSLAAGKAGQMTIPVTTSNIPEGSTLQVSVLGGVTGISVNAGKVDSSGKATVYLTSSGGVAAGSVTVTVGFSGALAQSMSITVMPSGTDKASLNSLISIANAKSASNYTSGSFANMQNKLSSAISAANNLGATSAQIENAATELSAAIEALVDISALSGKYDAARAMLTALQQDPSNLTLPSYVALKNAVESAGAVLGKGNATKGEVGSAWEKIELALGSVGG